MFIKLKSGVNVTSGALSVAVKVVVNHSDTFPHRHTGGANIHATLALTTNTTNGGLYSDVFTVP